MKELKHYICDGCMPTENEILETINISKKENCAVILRWYDSYNKHYDLIITDITNLEECINIINENMYGLPYNQLHL